jgi:hypothetical protein
MNCILQYVIEGKINGGLHMTGRRGRGSKQLINYYNEKRGYLNLKRKF